MDSFLSIDSQQFHVISFKYPHIGLKLIITFNRSLLYEIDHIKEQNYNS